MTARVFLLLLALMVPMTFPVRADDTADNARLASEDFQAAIIALEAAESARDRVAALTATIRAYEEGLSLMREALRDARLREATLAYQFEAKRERVSQLVGLLTQLENDPAPLLLLHPQGPLGTARSAMLLAGVAPAVQAEADAIREELDEMRQLRTVQTAAGETLARGLKSAQVARTSLSQAISDRIDLPHAFTEDPEVLRGLLESADTLAAFASSLAPSDPATRGRSFQIAKGRLPLPVNGTLIRKPGEADAAGVRRPGITLATRPRALVTAPWSATIRYLGPLLDYGNVIILEPGDGYLLVLSGMETLYGSLGEVIAADSPLGLMAGDELTADAFLAEFDEQGAVQETETLYMELRQGTEAVNPLEWFTATAPELRPRGRAATKEE